MAKRGNAERVRQLEAALEQQIVVRITREPKRAPSLEGVVVGVGIRWLIVWSGDVDGGSGFRAVRLRDVEAVHVRGGAADGSGRERTVPQPHADPTTTGTLLLEAGSAYGCVCVHQERRSRPRRRVGKVDSVADKELHLHTVDPATGAPRKRKVIPFRDITRIDFGFELIGGSDR